MIGANVEGTNTLDTNGLDLQRGSRMKRYIKTLLPITAILALVLAAIACSSADEAAPAAPAATAVPVAKQAAGAGTTGQQPALPAAATPVPAAEVELTYLAAPEDGPQRGGWLEYGFAANPPHLDLHQSGTTNNCTPQCPLFDLLVMNDPTDAGRGIIAQGLATSWEVSSDGKTFTFPLREGVKFHDGAPMTSADVKATFDRIIFPPDHVSSRRQALFAAVADDGVQAPDDFTFRLVLKEARAADFILNAFATGFNVIVRKQTLDDNNSDLRTIPNYPGTGPYRYKEHRDAEFWRIEANPDYWNPNLPYLDGINVYHMPDSQTKIAAFLAKKSDYARVIDPKSYHEWVADTPEGMKLHRYSQTTVQGIWMKQDTGGPLSDVRVRRAINLIIDRDAMEDSVFKTVSLNGFGCGYVFRWSPWASSYEDLRKRPTCVPTAEKGPYLEEAKALLEEAGYGDGLDLSIKYANTDHYAVWGPVIAQLLTEQGINIKQSPLDGPVAIQSIQDGNFDLAVSYAVFPFGDPSSYMRAWYGCGSTENYGGFCDAGVDALLDKIDSELDTTKRKEYVTELDALLEEKVPFATAAWEEFADAYWEYVHGQTGEYSVGIYNAERRGTWWLDQNSPHFPR